LREIFETNKPSGFELVFWQMLSDDEQQLALAQADYFMVGAYKITEEMLLKASLVKFIQKNGIGVDNIDLIAAGNLGIPVSNVPGGNTPAVAEFTIGAIISVYRKLVALDKATKSGNWMMWDWRPFTYEMRGKVHGVVGFGNIGREVARLSQAFGTKVLYYDVKRLEPSDEQTIGASYAALNELLQQSDIVSVHVPLLPSTRNMIGSKELGLMKPTAILINVARGNIVNEEALYAALSEQKLLGAALDVWASEPVPPDNKLLGLDNLLATPHIAAGTRDTFKDILNIAFENIKSAQSGRLPKFIVNKTESMRTL
jgi:D-3-phosphoglycerate dehydrogenase